MSPPKLGVVFEEKTILFYYIVSKWFVVNKSFIRITKVKSIDYVTKLMVQQQTLIKIIIV